MESSTQQTDKGGEESAKGSILERGSVSTDAESPQGQEAAPAEAQPASKKSSSVIEGEKASPSTDWESLFKSLPEDVRQDSTLKPIKSFEGLVKSYVHAQRAMGKEKITIPDKHATPEDWQQVFKKLGNPESVDEYKVKAPEGADVNEEFLEKFKHNAHEAGVLPHQAEKLLNWYVDYSTELHQNMQENTDRQMEEGVKALEKEWGKAYDSQVKRAQIAFKELVPDADSREEMLASGLGNNPAFIKMLAKASKYFQEDVFLGAGEGGMTSLTPEEALKKARQIQGDPNHPYRNRAHPNHTSAKKEVADLYRLAFPE